ncbi:MAG: hypothetical protein ACI9W4_002319 [Rhodothermales bacterium]|jgi:hypothetical protein
MTETREELEAKLQSASDSMSRRLTAMESEVSLPAVTRLTDVASSGTFKKAAIAVGVGLAVGLLFGGGGKKRIKRAHTTIDEWRDDLADSITEFLQGGDSPGDAARRAARSQPPLILEDGERGGAKKGLLAFAFTYALKTGITVGARELVKRMMDRNDEPETT